MTCYWDSIISSLTKEDYALIGFNNIPRREIFIEKLKEKNNLINALWQGKSLTKKEQEEHMEAIKCYNILLKLTFYLYFYFSTEMDITRNQELGHGPK